MLNVTCSHSEVSMEPGGDGIHRHFDFCDQPATAVVLHEAPIASPILGPDGLNDVDWMPTFTGACTDHAAEMIRQFEATLRDGEPRAEFRIVVLSNSTRQPFVLSTDEIRFLEESLQRDAVGLLHAGLTTNHPVYRRNRSLFGRVWDYLNA